VRYFIHRSQKKGEQKDFFKFKHSIVIRLTQVLFERMAKAKGKGKFSETALIDFDKNL